MSQTGAAGFKIGVGTEKKAERKGGMGESMENGFLILKPQEAEEIIDKLPPEEEMQDLAEFFKVFGDSTRLKIMLALQNREMCVYDISTLLGMSQSAISHQLRILKQMALVKNRRDGKTIFYAPADDHIVSILSQGLDHIEE